MSIIINTTPLGFPWATQDPFLFCVYHEDFYPKGSENLGPSYDLIKSRNLGEDFVLKDGFRMYHGTVIPGFPAHPHRGFETITVVNQGIVDHCDSFGGAARYGNGDTQWLTAGKGVQHAEMFPLLNQDKDNPLELFQIWLNLPKKQKFAEPFYKIFWNEDQPQLKIADSNKKQINVKLIAGQYKETKSINPPPNSWAAEENNHLWVWEISVQALGTFTIPKSFKGLNRSLYFYKGEAINHQGKKISVGQQIILKSDFDFEFENLGKDANFLLLQGRPISEPVEQYGPFVMNTRDEIAKAIQDYQMTEFGGWPWSTQDPTHGPRKGRFAKFPDGKIEVKEKSFK